MCGKTQVLRFWNLIHVVVGGDVSSPPRDRPRRLRAAPAVRAPTLRTIYGGFWVACLGVLACPTPRPRAISLPTRTVEHQRRLTK